MKLTHPSKDNNRVLKNALFPILIFCFIFSFAYFNYIMYLNIALVSHDTINYADNVLSIKNNLLPINNLTIDIPLGYPIFLYLLYEIGANVTVIIWIQLLLFFSSCIFLISSTRNLNSYSSILTALLIGFYSITPDVMKMNTSMLPDSIYCSLLIFIVALMTFRINQKSILLDTIIFFMIIIEGLIRSNGFYLYFIPIILIFFDLRTNKTYSYKLIFCFTFILFLGASFNYHFKGYFFPADMRRILVKLNTNEDFEYKSVKNQNSISEKATYYLFHTFYEEADFYYSVLPARFSWNQNFLDDSSLKEHNKRFQTDTIVAFLNKNYNTNHINKNTVSKYMDFKSRDKNLINYSLHIIYKFLYIIFYKTQLITIVFLLTLIISTKNYFKERTQITQFSLNQLILILGMIHIFSVILLSVGHPIYITRYITVTDFIPIFVLVIGIKRIIKLKQNIPNQFKY
jgi:hypothetical protein